MTYPLLDHVNRRNSAELARVVNLSAAELVRVESLEWAPPTEEVRTRSGRSLGRGDKIRCGESIDGDIADFGSQRGRTYKRESWNVCRPFDEAHAANIAAGHDGEYAYPSIRVLAEEFDGEDVVKQENFLARLIAPPNHGHGAPCGCVTVAKLYELQDIVFPSGAPGSLTGKTTAIFRGKRVAILNPQIKKTPATIECVPFDCPHCSGTGRLICDDERAGRVSPSHAAGGYAEWQRRQLRITAVDWDAGIARFGPYVESK